MPKATWAATRSSTKYPSPPVRETLTRHEHKQGQEARSGSALPAKAACQSRKHAHIGACRVEQVPVIGLLDSVGEEVERPDRGVARDGDVGSDGRGVVGQYA